MRSLVRVLAVVWLLLLATPAAAETPITATATPAQVALPPGRSATVLLTLTNSAQSPTTAAIRVVASEDTITTTPAATTVPLGPGQSRTETFKVTRTAEGSGQDVGLSFVVDSPGASAVVAASVKAVPSAPLATATVESGPDRVNQNRPGSATIVIGTDRETAVRVTALTATPAPDTWLEATCPDGRTAQWRAGRSDSCAFDLKPRAKQAIPVRVYSDDLTAPGTRSALFSITAQEGDDAATATTLALTMPVTLEVFGESDIVQSLGVPVFLVVPGVVTVLVVGFLLRRVRPRFPAAESESVVAAVTWTTLLGVLVSLVMAKLFPLLTGWLWPGTRRDYTQRYNFLDLYLVLAYSVGVAVVVWLLVVLVHGVWAATRVPSPDDSPRTLLWKLATRDTLLPLVEVDGTPAVLMRRTKTGEVIVAPRIQVEATADSALPQKVEDLVRRHEPARLWWLLDRAISRQEAVLSYHPGDITEVRVVPEVTAIGRDTDVVRMATEA
ncbi:hypothetical protein CLV40_109138 [Actinokineospora auranticolor]|uniref:Uncharacterized protein n=1 Tax=Actinokineospora auranticolor TaxID=155976 RepID=A0A2S6GNK7_9PSEU|nr:hypothetical protein CLV40_109138 [Actinokineospora auranticolor]